MTTHTCLPAEDAYTAVCRVAEEKRLQIVGLRRSLLDIRDRAVKAEASNSTEQMHGSLLDISKLAGDALVGDR